MEKDKQIRLDILVAKKAKILTRSHASKLIESGMVSINNKVITKPSTRIPADSKLVLKKIKSHRKDLDLPVIYEDDDVVVINKPKGILTHSKGSFNEEETIAEWLNRKLGRKGKTNREGIVHRLDRGTSGVMILAKNEEAEKWLSKQFSSRKVTKVYIAVVEGHLDTKEAIIDMPITRNPKRPQSFKTSPNGKPSQTKYKVIEEGDKYSLLELTPTTGRTHQLRVHLSAISHPIVGDTFYGAKESDRIYLHAKSLKLTLPSKTQMQFTSDLPKEFSKLI